MLDLKSMSLHELTEYIAVLGEPKYRATQIYTSLIRGASFGEMNLIPAKLRQTLMAQCDDTIAEVSKRQISKDGTQKLLYGFADGEFVESVLMKYKHGNTICISSQAGCRMGCSFCASTANGLRRNLTAGEMLEQIIRTQVVTGEKISNIVMMGIGEPLDNYANTIKFLKLVNEPEGLNIGMRHISVSTCGIVEKIDELAKSGLQLTLSVSLHAPNDRIRKQIMAVANKYSYESLLAACERYEKATGRRISFEYAMIDGVNDSDRCAHELGRNLAGTLAHVNLIPYNKVSGKAYGQSDKSAINSFIKILESYKINTTVRRSLGNDIEAACGQLRAKTINT